jgi:hypothetical protein
MSNNIEQVKVRIEHLAKRQLFNDEMFTWLCEDIAFDIEKFGNSPELKEQLKGVIHGRTEWELEARRLSGKRNR